MKERMTGKVCSLVLIQDARWDLQQGGSKKSALAKELSASPLLEATWTRCDLEANPE